MRHILPGAPVTDPPDARWREQGPPDARAAVVWGWQVRGRAVVLGAVLGVLTLLAVPVVASAPSLSAPAPAATRIGPGGSWCWFSDSRAVHRAGTTYSSWIDISGRIYVGAYEHLTDRMSTFALATRFDPDDHNNPSLLVHHDGHLSAFWSGHNGTAIHVRTTTRPGDIQSFGPRRDIPSKVPGDAVLTYTNPVQVPAENNRIYLFWRSHHTHQAYATSDDGGRTWSPARVLIDQPGHRPYVKYDHRGGVIAAAFTDGHPRETASSVHYAALRDGALWRADGTLLQRLDAGPLRPQRADVLWDAKRTGVRAWVWDVAQDALGRPVVVFATFPAADDHRYHYARWDGTRWAVQELTRAGGSIADHRETQYSAGISLDHDDPSTLVLSRRSSRGVWEIERWTTPDGGASWRTTALTSNSPADNFRPVVTRGLGAMHEAGVSWLRGSYGYFTTYDTDVMTAGTLPAAQDLATATHVNTSARRVDRGANVRVNARLVDADGRGLGDREVTLLVRDRGTRVWHRVVERRTDGSGRVSFAPRVRGDREFAVEWPGNYVHRRSASPAVSVLVNR